MPRSCLESIEDPHLGLTKAVPGIFRFSKEVFLLFHLKILQVSFGNVNDMCHKVTIPLVSKTSLRLLDDGHFYDAS